jgi:hypothetical protein
MMERFDLDTINDLKTLPQNLRPTLGLYWSLEGDLLSISSWLVPLCDRMSDVFGDRRDGVLLELKSLGGVELPLGAKRRDSFDGSVSIDGRMSLHQMSHFLRSADDGHVNLVLAERLRRGHDKRSRGAHTYCLKCDTNLDWPLNNTRENGTTTISVMVDLIDASERGRLTGEQLREWITLLAQSLTRVPGWRYGFAHVTTAEEHSNQEYWHQSPHFPGVSGLTHLIYRYLWAKDAAWRERSIPGLHWGNYFAPTIRKRADPDGTLLRRYRDVFQAWPDPPSRDVAAAELPDGGLALYMSPEPLDYLERGTPQPREPYVENAVWLYRELRARELF